MSHSFDDIRRQTLERQRAERIEEYEAVAAQIGRALDAASRLRLQREASHLEQQIRQIDVELKAIANPDPPTGATPQRTPPAAQPTELPPSLGDALTVAPEKNGRPYKAGPAQWWIRLKVESNKTVQECRGQIYDILKLQNEEDSVGEHLPTAQATILSWADNNFNPISIEPYETHYLDLAWRATGDPPIPDSELRVASARDQGKRNTASPEWGRRQDFIPLQPGHYLLVVRFTAKDSAPLERRFRLHWPGPGHENEILLTAVSETPTPESAVEQPPPHSAVPPSSTSGDTPSPPGALETAANFIKQWLSVQFLLWTAVSAVGFASNLGSLLALSYCTRLGVITTLIFLGGAVILSVSLLPAFRSHYQMWDRGLTALMTAALTIALLASAWQNCASFSLLPIFAPEPTVVLTNTPTLTNTTVTVAAPSLTPTLEPTLTPEPTPTFEPTPRPTAPSVPPALVQPTTPTGRIVYTCFVDGVDQICIIDADGSNQRQLTFNQATNFYPSFSPDGRQIVFTSRRDGAFGIYIMNSDGSDQRLIAQGGGGLYAPVISPDGRQIAYTSDGNIWVMDIDGSNARVLTDTPDTDLNPAWSPDGVQISFFSNRDGVNGHYIMDANGGNLRRVPVDLPEIAERSEWSPDGRWLVFHTGLQSNRNIYIIAVDGSDLYRVTRGGNSYVPSFSPDGQWLAFNSFRGGNTQLLIMRLDGSDATQLTFENYNNWQPRWGP